MQKERMKCILSGMKRYELTPAETEFLAFAEGSLDEDGPPVKIVEMVLERIYSRKTEFIRNSIVSMLRKEAARFHPAGTGSKVRFSSRPF